MERLYLVNKLTETLRPLLYPMQYYKKTDGATTTLGQKYEYGICALSYCRMLCAGKRFSLGSNFGGLGAFDDVFITNLESGASYCIQLKHKEKGNTVSLEDLLQKTGKFSLEKYYESFCQIEDVVCGDRNGVNSDIIRKINLDKFYCILYTNSPVDHELHENSNLNFSEIEAIIGTGSSVKSTFSFGKDDVRVWNMKNNCIDKDRYTRFLNKLLIFSEQATAEEVLTAVEQEISRYLNKSVDEAKTLTNCVLNSMESWWINDHFLLTESSPHWHLALIKELNKGMDLQKFQDMTQIFQTGINSIYDNCPYLHIIVHGVDADIRCVKIWTTIQTNYRDNYLMIRTTDIMKRPSVVKNVCKSGYCNTVIINMDDSNILKSLKFVETGVKRIIIVSDHRVRLPVKYESIEDTWALSDLTPETHQTILEKIVKLQGEGIILSNLADRNTLLDVVSGRGLASILNDEEILLGRQLPSVDPLYINRSLHHRKLLNHSDQCVDFNMYKHWEEIESSSPSSVIMSTEYEDVGCNCVAEPMSNECKSFTLGCMKDDTFPEDWPQKVRFIVGETGMGKSYLLTYMAKTRKQRFPDLWMIVVSLDEYLTCFSSMAVGAKTCMDITMDMLYHAAGVDDPKHSSSSMAKRLLFHSLNVKGNVVVFLDAVDEVLYAYRHEVSKVVELLQTQLKLKELWITAKPFSQPYIQKQLVSEPLFLQPFDEKQQRKYLWNYFLKFGIKENDAGIMVDYTLQQFETPGRHFCNNPLHARLIADIISKTPNPFSIKKHELYKDFFNAKQDNYISDKNKMCNTNQIVRTMKEETLERLLKTLEEYALRELFTEDQLKQLNVTFIKDFLEKYSADIELQRLGIVDDIVNGKPRLVHRSLSEYLVAHWLKTHHESGTRTTRGKYECMLVWEGFENIRQFYDLMISDK